MNIDFEFEVHRDFASNCRRPVNRVAKSMPQTRLDLPLSVECAVQFYFGLYFYSTIFYVFVPPFQAICKSIFD